MAPSVGIHRKGEVGLMELLEDLKKKDRMLEAGAIVIFIGVVRGFSKSGEEVERLEFEAYEGNAEKDLKEIVEDLRKRPGVIDVMIHHNIGELKVGDEIVYILVAGAHREDAFKAAEEAINQLKKRTAIWKKEVLKSGESYWISEEP